MCICNRTISIGCIFASMYLLLHFFFSGDPSQGDSPSSSFCVSKIGCETLSFLSLCILWLHFCSSSEWRNWLCSYFFFSLQ